MYKVLVVDDDPSVLKIMELLGQRHDFEVLPASNAQDAHRIVKRHTPDAIVMDLELPDGYGLQILRELRARGVDAFAIVLAGRIGTLDMKTWAEDRIFDFMLKPFEVESLAKKVEAAASATQGEESLCEFLRGVIDRNSTPLLAV